MPSLKYILFLAEEWLDPNHERVLRLQYRNLRLLRQLGEGGFAFVYLAKEVRTGQRFALKRVRIQLEEQQEAFDREVRAHYSVNHPNVIKLLDHAVLRNARSGRCEGVMLLPFYRNGTAQDLIERAASSGQPLPMAQVMRIFFTVCNALLAFHKADPPQAFRDLKPANILMDNDSGGVLTDLGSVAPARVKINSRRDALQLEEVAAETCSAPYRAPELFAVPSTDTSIDERTDIWSLGCVLFALAFVRQPFDGTHTSTMGNIPFPAPDSPEMRRFPYPPALIDLIRYLLVVDHMRRPTCEEGLAKARELGLL